MFYILNRIQKKHRNVTIEEVQEIQQKKHKRKQDDTLYGVKNIFFHKRFTEKNDPSCIKNPLIFD